MCILVIGTGISVFWFWYLKNNVLPTYTFTTSTLPTATTTDDGEFTTWHTYNNPAFGYQFQYPAAYDLDDRYADCSITSNDNGLSIGSRSYIQTDPDQHLTLEQFIKKTFNEHKEEEWKVEGRNETTVGSEPAITFEYRFGSLNRLGKLTFVHHGSSFYTLAFEAGAFACGDEPSVYEHILKTFDWAEYYED